MSQTIYYFKKMRVRTPTTLLNYGVTGPKFTRFYTQCSRSSQINCLKSEWRYFNPLRNAKVTNNVYSPILPILTLKLVTMSTSLEPLEKGGQMGQMGNLRSNTYTTMVMKRW